MITAGTVEAYLRLKTDDFKVGIREAIEMLSSLKAVGDNAAGGFGLLTGAVAAAAQALSGDLTGAMRFALASAVGFSEIYGGIVPAVTSVAAGVGVVAVKTAASMLGMEDAACSASAGILHAMSGAASGLATASGQMTGAAGGAAAGITSAMGVAASGTAASSALVAAAMQGASGAVSNASAAIAAATGNAATGTAKSASQMSSAMQRTATDTGTTSGSIVAQLAQMAANAVAKWKQAAEGANQLNAAQTKAKTIVTGIAADITATLSGLVSSAGNIMRQVGQGMANGLSSMVGAIVSVARSIAQRVTSTISAALDIASPSRVMRRLGRFTAEGFALGIADKAEAAVAQTKALAQGVTAAAEGADGIRLTLPHMIMPAVPKQSTEGYAGELRGVGSAVEALIDRLGTFLDSMEGTEQIMQVDGRSFGRLIREHL